MVTAKNREMFEINARFDLGRDRVEKIIAVLLRLKAHNIGAEHSLENFLAPRTDRKLRGGGPWDVPKYRYLRVGAAPLDQRGDERKMVILHKNQRPLYPVYFFKQRLGEETVDFAILRPVFFAEYRPYMREMAQRPERFVGKAVVVPLYFFAREPYALQRVPRLVMRNANFVFLIYGELIGFARSVRDPHAAGCLHNGFERGYDAPRGHGPFDAVLAARIHVRFSIGYDEYGPVFYVRLNKFFEPFGSPWRVEFFKSHARLLTRRKARLPKAARHLCDFT